MLVEVVSRSSVDRDYGDKRSIYAAGGAPGYLIVDPMAAQCVLLTEPYGEGEQTTGSSRPSPSGWTCPCRCSVSSWRRRSSRRCRRSSGTGGPEGAPIRPRAGP
ncbi:Uma2 family endonuclease [Streptomyces albidoflavus]|uniref:Uma2 family endonuclease n=1 Tax=Streptomyces albidoflavus TaxID=1886 RepID=UPI003527B6BF